MPADIGLRAVTPSDDAFLLRLYGTTRPDVAMFGWDAAEQQAFLRMQFDVQARSYSMQSPDSEQSVIMFDGGNAGRLIVDRSGSDISLTDIAVLPEFRGKGIATTIITRLQREAGRTGRSIHLSVDRMNAKAFQLYRKLGFDVVDEGQLQLSMRWTPDKKPR
jgi:ribosomal protein S18 acetylase RimI-like enzyme